MKGKIQVHSRYVKLQSSQTVADDPIYALVELITNSHVAYRHLEKIGNGSTGVIQVDFFPKKKGTVFGVTDFAIGMDDKDFEKKIKTIGGNTSGLDRSSGGRSFMGRGLKEVMIHYGYGNILSVKNDKIYEIGIHGATQEWDEEPVKNCTLMDRQDFGISRTQNFTKVTIKAINPNIQTPQFDTLVEQLSKYFELRDILQDPNRRLILRYHHQGKIKEKDIKYSQSLPSKVFRTENVNIDGYPDAMVQVQVYKSESDIPRTTDVLFEGGFLVCSKDAIHAIDDFGFSGHPASSRIHGRVYSEYIDFLMREKEEMLFDASRSGKMNTKNLFVKALKKSVAIVLDRVYKEVEQELSQDRERVKDEETDQRVQKALDFLNKEAKKLLEFLDEKPGTGSTSGTHKKKDLPPPDGFNFMPPYYQIPPEKNATVTLKLDKEYLGETKKKITIQSQNPGVVIIAQSDWEHKELFSVIRFQVKGKSVGDSSVITAKLGNLITRATIEVVDARKGSGLFSDYELLRGISPEQRVQLIRSTGVIQISLDAPSIKPFFSKERLRKVETKLLLAELILNSCCDEISRLMILNNRIPILSVDPNSITEQARNVTMGLVNKFAKPVQDLILRGKMGEIEEHLYDQ